jgi:hypothetical protein
MGSLQKDLFCIGMSNRNRWWKLNNIIRSHMSSMDRDVFGLRMSGGDMVGSGKGEKK